MIASDITQTDGIKVGLLIGANCMKALEPMKVISSVDSSPYAYRRRLGWCIVGPNINMVGKKSIGCNRVAVIDATSSNISSYHFVVKEAMKEVRLEEMFQTITRMISMRQALSNQIAGPKRMQERFPVKTGDSLS